MAHLSKDIQSVGSDTRQPMLDRSDFASWQQCICLYCMGKDNRENIIKSIDEGPFKMGKLRETLAEGEEGALHLGPEQDRVYADLLLEEKEGFKADIRATNILLQGLPKDIYTLINHYTDNKGKTIHDYYVRFTKLINNMRNIKMTMPKMQLNLKFISNMLPEWGRFMTLVKLNIGLKESNYDQLYAYLKQHEAHDNENKMMLERYNQHAIDPLALVPNVSPQHVISPLARAHSLEGCPATRRSTSGYYVFLGDNLLTWSSKCQDTLSRSSAKAEYRGVANVVAETSWICNLLYEIHTSLFTATLVYCDNVSAVYMSANPV
nr:NBS-containing resistance-like protein [Tanacetum cinerariifolium]